VAEAQLAVNVAIFYRKRLKAENINGSIKLNLSMKSLANTVAGSN